MRSYDIARSYFSVLSTVCWLAIIGGAAIAVESVSLLAQSRQFVGNAAILLSLAPGVAIAIVALFGLVHVQSGRANVDSAEYAQQALKVSRDQLEVSRQLMKLAAGGYSGAAYQAPTQATDLQNVSFDTADAPPARANETPIGTDIEYGGKTITKDADGFLVDGRSFETQVDAMLAIDRTKEPVEQ